MVSFVWAILSIVWHEYLQRTSAEPPTVYFVPRTASMALAAARPRDVCEHTGTTALNLLRNEIIYASLAAIG